MNKELEKIQKHCIDILSDYPEKRAELVDRLETADAELMKARNLQETSQDLESYDRATEVVKRAELGRKFAKQALDRLDGAPRMDEAEYLKAVNVCKEYAETAIATYRKKAADLMDQLLRLRSDYLDAMDDANRTLIRLDEAANVLQSKYPYEEVKFVGEPSLRRPDKKAWIQHALRYDYKNAMIKATESDPDEREYPYETNDSILNAAWFAIEKGFPGRYF